MEAQDRARSTRQVEVDASRRMTPSQRLERALELSEAAMALDRPRRLQEMQELIERDKATRTLRIAGPSADA